MSATVSRGGDGALTRVDFTVAAHAVGVYDALEARGQLVGLVVSGRGLLGLHPVEDGGHGGAALLLDKQTDLDRSRPNVLAPGVKLHQDVFLLRKTFNLSMCRCHLVLIKQPQLQIN